MNLKLADSLGGTNTEAEFEFFMQVISAEFTWNDLLLSFEYFISDTEIDLLGTKTEGTASSYYGAASYRFTDLFTLGAYYSVKYVDDDDKDGDTFDPSHSAWQKDLAMTFRFDLNEYWVFKVEGHWVDGTADLVAIDNLDDNESFNNTEDSWYYGAAKITFSFKPHFFLFHHGGKGPHWVESTYFHNFQSRRYHGLATHANDGIRFRKHPSPFRPDKAVKIRSHQEVPYGC